MRLRIWTGLRRLLRAFPVTCIGVVALAALPVGMFLFEGTGPLADSDRALSVWRVLLTPAYAAHLAAAMLAAPLRLLLGEAAAASWTVSYAAMLAPFLAIDLLLMWLRWKADHGYRRGRRRVPAGPDLAGPPAA